MSWLGRILHLLEQQQVSSTDEPGIQQQVREQINPTFFASSSSPTQEDAYWGKLASGGEEDYLWRRLSDSPFIKDVIPITFPFYNHRTRTFSHCPLYTIPCSCIKRQSKYVKLLGIGELYFNCLLLLTPST